MEWIKFSDKLPSNKRLEQVDILFSHPKWATFWKGMYTHYIGFPLKECITYYNPEKDRYCEWEGMKPTHYIKVPKLINKQ
jgi:hypothetical protein